MFIKDRGNIKWNSLMLVEHKKELEKLRDSEDLKEKPQLDEQELKRLNNILKKALELKKNASIVYYSRGEFKEIKGIIKKYLAVKRQLIIINDGRKKYLDIDNIFKIEIN